MKLQVLFCLTEFCIFKLISRKAVASPFEDGAGNARGSLAMEGS